MTLGEANNVTMSPKELEDLIRRYGEQYANDKIQALSAYLKIRRKKYASHYWVIREWARREKTIELATPVSLPLIEEAEIMARAEALFNVNKREGHPQTLEWCRDAIKGMDRERRR